jgi:hypothetical protein
MLLFMAGILDRMQAATAAAINQSFVECRSLSSRNALVTRLKNGAAQDTVLCLAVRHRPMVSKTNATKRPKDQQQ